MTHNQYPTRIGLSRTLLGGRQLGASTIILPYSNEKESFYFMKKVFLLEKSATTFIVARLPFHVN